MSSNSVAACVVPCTRLCRDSNLELSRVTSCLNGTAPLLRYECLCMEQPLPFPTWVWIALGVGLFLAVSALVFVVWWCLFRKRTRIHKDTADVEGAKLLEGSHVPKSITNQMSEVMSVAALSELPSYEPELVAAVKSNDAMAIEKLLLEPFTNVVSPPFSEPLYHDAN